MSRETERTLLTAHFRAFWQAHFPAVPIAWPNGEFSTPENKVFGIFNMVDRGSTRESLGRTYLKRHRGTIQIDIYTPADKGVGESRRMTDVIEATYDSLDLVTSDGQPVLFRTPSARPIAGNEMRASNLDDNWSRYVVELPYERSEVVAR